MNERIKELALQAGHPGFPQGEIELQKFAELLIEQCVTCVRYTDKDHIFTAQDAGVVGAAHDRAMKAIRKHFGVEE